MLLVYNIEMKAAKCVIFNFPSPHKYMPTLNILLLIKVLNSVLITFTVFKKCQR